MPQLLGQLHVLVILFPYVSDACLATINIRDFLHSKRSDITYPGSVLSNSWSRYNETMADNFVNLKWCIYNAQISTSLARRRTNSFLGRTTMKYEILLKWYIVGMEVGLTYQLIMWVAVVLHIARDFAGQSPLGEAHYAKPITSGPLREAPMGVRLLSCRSREATFDWVISP